MGLLVNQTRWGRGTGLFLMKTELSSEVERQLVLGTEKVRLSSEAKLRVATASKEQAEDGQEACQCQW